MKDRPHIRFSLFRQFLLLSAVICCVVTAALAAMFVYVTRYSLRASRELLENLHQQAVLRLEEYAAAIENEAYIICYSPTLQDYIQEDSISARMDMTENLKSLHSGAYLAVDGLIGIAAFQTDGQLIHSSDSSLFVFEGLPAEYLGITGCVYTGVYAPSSDSGLSRSSFAMVTPVYSLQPASRLLGEPIGILSMTFSTDHLSAIVKSNRREGCHLILTDAEGTLIAVSSQAAADYYEKKSFETSAPASALETVLEGSGWKLQSYLPKSFMTDEIKPLVWIASIAGGCFLLLLLLLLSMLQSRILRPIREIGGFMERVPKDPEPVSFTEGKDDELGAMISMMNQMILELDRKSHDLLASESKRYELELSRRDMEILACRNQINPHFLYNTLDCICSIAMFHGADDIAQITESLSDMFRYAVKGDSFATIEEELSYVREYSAIIGYRFMGRIRFRIEADPETLELPVIKLLIQPLAENAVFHGLERQTRPGTVRILVRLQSQSELVLSVVDDGVGIPEKMLEELRSDIEEAARSGSDVPAARNRIGLANIARRLRLYYGEHSSLRIASTEGKGTAVTVILHAAVLKESGRL